MCSNPQCPSGSDGTDSDPEIHQLLVDAFDDSDSEATPEFVDEAVSRFRRAKNAQ